jgi:hypothetical protein
MRAPNSWPGRYSWKSGLMGHAAFEKHGAQGYLQAETRLCEQGIPAQNPMMLALAYARLQ